MFLFECGCQCFFTLKEFPDESHGWPRCPNCLKYIPIDTKLTIIELLRMRNRSGVSVREIPNDAKITVVYNL